MRIYDNNGYMIPHCNLCMEELKLGEKVIMDSLLWIQCTTLLIFLVSI
jgi:hypothetical protein